MARVVVVAQQMELWQLPLPPHLQLLWEVEDHRKPPMLVLELRQQAVVARLAPLDTEDKVGAIQEFSLLPHPNLTLVLLLAAAVVLVTMVQVHKVVPAAEQMV
jgi:hypothetical protein